MVATDLAGEKEKRKKTQATYSLWGLCWQNDQSSFGITDEGQNKISLWQRQSTVQLLHAKGNDFNSS